MVGANDPNEVKNIEARNVLNTLQERVNFGITSIKTKHSLNISNILDNHKRIEKINHGYLLSLREKCPYSELFWSVFSRIQTE